MSSEEIASFFDFLGKKFEPECCSEKILSQRERKGQKNFGKGSTIVVNMISIQEVIDEALDGNDDLDKKQLN